MKDVLCCVVSSWIHLLFIPHASTKLKGGILVSPCPSVRPSVCPSVCPSVRTSVDRKVSTLYLHQYSPDPFHIYISYQATSKSVLHIMFSKNSKIWNFRKFFKFVTLTLSCFHPIWISNMGNHGEAWEYPQNAVVLFLVCCWYCNKSTVCWIFLSSMEK